MERWSMIKIKLCRNIDEVQLADREVEIFPFWSADGPPVNDERWGRNVRCSKDDGEVTADEGAMDPRETVETIVFEVERDSLAMVHIEEADFISTFKVHFDELDIKYQIVSPSA